MSKLHIDVLLLLKATGDYGLRAETMLVDLRSSRHRDLTQPQLEQALRDLADRSLVDQFASVLEQKRWRILALGLSALREANL